MKRLKDKKVHEYTIRVHTFRELYKTCSNGYKWGDKNWCAWIDYGHSKTGIGGFKTQDELFDSLRDNLYLPKKEIYLKDFLMSKLDRTYKWLKRKLI